MTAGPWEVNAALVAGRVHRRRRPRVRRSRSSRWRPSASPARDACSTSAAVRGRWRGSRRTLPASTGRRRRPDVGAGAGRGRARRRPASTRAATEPRAAVRGRLRSTPSSPASCSSTSRDVDAAIAEVARVLGPAGASVLPQPPAAADAEQRLDRRPDPRPARAVLAHRRRTSSRTRRSRRWRRACSSRSSTAR